jgi:hypothetical protein
MLKRLEKINTNDNIRDKDCCISTKMILIPKKEKKHKIKKRKH